MLDGSVYSWAVVFLWRAFNLYIFDANGVLINEIFYFVIIHKFEAWDVTVLKSLHCYKLPCHLLASEISGVGQLIAYIAIEIWQE